MVLPCMMERLKWRVRKGLAGRFLKELSTLPSVRSFWQTVCGADVILTENSFQTNSGRFFFSKLQHYWFLSISTFDKGDRINCKRRYWVQTISKFLTQRQSLLLCWKGLQGKQSSIYFIFAIWIMLLGDELVVLEHFCKK